MRGTMDLVDVFDNFFRNWDSVIVPAERLYDFNFPPMNVWVDEKSKDLIFEFAVAGISKEKISASFEGDYMFLQIEAGKEEKVEGMRLLQRGIRSSSLKQRIYVPSAKYETKDATAEYNEGILKIHIPAKDDIKPRRLEIRSPKMISP